jgi:hypothetical protein
MILQRLCEYYDRIAGDPHIDIAQLGFAPQKVSFEVVIDVDGSLVAKSLSTKMPLVMRQLICCRDEWPCNENQLIYQPDQATITRL